MRIKMFAILLTICVFAGCSNEHFTQPMEAVFFGHDANDVHPTGELGLPPPHIAEALWGERYDLTLNVLLEYEDWKDRGKGEVFKPVVDHHFSGFIMPREMQRKYYTKYIDADGIAILGNDYIPDQYFYAAREIVFEMTSKQPILRKLLAFKDEDRPNLTGATFVPSPHFRMILYHTDQGATAIPERFPRAPNWVGFCAGTTCIVPVGVQNFIIETGPPVVAEVRIWITNIFVHEFAHAIHFAIRLISRDFDTRLNEAFAEAVENDSAFAGVPVEHWAVTTQNWFKQFSRGNRDENVQYQRFKERNPKMHALMEEWFDFKNLEYIDRKLQ